MASATATFGKMGRVPASPLARRLARLSGIDLGLIGGSGPGGRVRRRDLEAHLASSSSVGARGADEHDGSPATSGSATPTIGEVESGQPQSAPASGCAVDSPMPLTFAQRVATSKATVPHFYLTVDCAIDKTLDVLAELNRQRAEAEHFLTVEDVVLRTVALSMADFPQVNATWHHDHIRTYRSADVAIVMAGHDGPVTPVIRAADRKGLGRISSEAQAFRAQAKAGSLAPEGCAGGSFAIYSLGAGAIHSFAAIIPVPQTCILALGAPQERAVVRDGGIVAATIMSCTLSADHRVVDGAVGAEFLATVRRRLENPLLLL